MTPEQQQASEDSLIAWALERGALTGTARNFAEAMVAGMSRVDGIVGVFSAKGLRDAGFGAEALESEDGIYVAQQDRGWVYISQEYVRAHSPNRGSWAGFKEAWRKSLAPLGEFLAEATTNLHATTSSECPRDALLPRLRRRDDPNVVTREFAEGLGLAVAADYPRGVTFVSGADLKSWGMTFDEALALAWKNWRVRAAKPRNPCPTVQRLRASKITEGVVGLLILDNEGYVPILALDMAPVGGVVLVISQECAVLTAPAEVNAECLLHVTNFAIRLTHEQRYRTEHFLCDEGKPVAITRIDDVGGIPRAIPLSLAPAHFGAPS